MLELERFLASELEYACRYLGHDGGAVSPSVYDTAQALRFLPADQHQHDIGGWLLETQAADGGWGEDSSALARDISSLAAILSPHAVSDCLHGVTEAVQAGLAFLRTGAEKWLAPAPADLPIAAELVLPHLLADAVTAGFELDMRPYAKLQAMGRHKCALLVQAQPVAGSAPTHSWEAWGVKPDPSLLDASGGLGHSPSATAAWLRAAEQYPGLADARDRAKQYLQQASLATHTGIPGVMPTVWPINRFEKIFFPYALTVTGVLERPQIRAALEPLLVDTQAAFAPDGLGHSDSFVCDGDDTAAGVAVMLGAGKPVDIAVLEPYERDNYFLTYPFELSPSFSTTARGTHAYALANCDVRALRANLQVQQEVDGRWLSDKWHSSWLYTTCHGIAAMGSGEARWSAINAVVQAQHEDGGFGTGHQSTSVETAYAILSICADRNYAKQSSRVRAAAARALNWMMRHYRSISEPISPHGTRLWLGKETYRPARVDQSFALAAFLTLVEWCREGLLDPPNGLPYACRS